MPLHLKRVLKGKRLLLWKEILVDLKYKDAGIIIDDVIKGFSLTGWAPKTGVFEPWVRKPEYSLEHLLKLSPALNAAVTGSLTSAAEGEHEQFVCQKEVEQGWLYPTDHSKPECIAKRFPLQQANKVRLIDGFSINGVNAAYGLREKLRVQSIDELCSYLAYILDHCDEPAALELLGRTFDLKQAYRQFGVDPYHHELLKIAVRKPSGSYQLFRVGALPFGAVGSVTAFLRISNCISFIASKALDIVLTAFFDDFTVVCRKSETMSATFCMEALFRMLGIWFADSGDKALPFNSVFKTLGLLISFEHLEAGSFQLEHTESRRNEVLQTLETLVGQDRCSAKELERLHGRLIWFNSFCFGRTLNMLIRYLSGFAHTASRMIAVEGLLLRSLEDLKGQLATVRPVQVHRDINKTWIIFTDGSFEPSSSNPAAVGAVLVSPSGIVSEFFGERVHKQVVDQLLIFSDHPIYELEILPVLLAATVWGQYIANSLVVVFLDNEAARSAYIQGTAATDAGRTFLKQFTAIEAEHNFFPWFGRVPTASNPADPPSRMSFTDAILKTG